MPEKQRVRLDASWKFLWLLTFAAFALVSLGQVPAHGQKNTPKKKKTADAPETPQATEVPAGFYGDQGGEKTAPADPKLPNKLLRARADDTFIKLSNPRIGDTRDKKQKAILIDYDTTTKGKYTGGMLILRAEDGSKSEIEMNSLVDSDSGTITLVSSKKSAKLPFPENLEFYIVRIETKFETPLKVMVSNSAVMGKMRAVTGARDWTLEEYLKWGKDYVKSGKQALPAYQNVNAHPNVGEDVPSLPKGPNPRRYVDPKGSLLGLEYSVGSWANRARISRVAPVYSVQQPRQHDKRIIAKTGYVVAGAEAHLETGEYCIGLRLIFCKTKADGSLDLKDSYMSEWIGTPPPAGKATTLANDGRKVLGIHTQNVVVIDRFALVVESK